MIEAGPLAALPDTLGRLAREVALSARGVAFAPTATLWPPGHAPLWCIPSAKASWRVYLSYDRSRRILFFFGRDEPPYVSIDAQVTLGLAMADRSGPERQPDIDWDVRLPGFFVRIPDHEFERYAPTGARSDETLAIRAGSGLLLIHLFDGDGPRRRPRLRFTTADSSLESEGPWYPIAPFLALLGELAATPARPGITVPQRERVDDSAAAVHQVIGSVLQGYLESVREINTVPPVTHRLLGSPAYAATAYSARVALRLTEDGELSTRARDEHHRIGLEIDVDTAADPHVARIVLRPDALTATGAHYDSFFDMLTETNARHALGELLGGESPLSAGLFATSARRTTVLLRTGASGTGGRYAVLMRGVLRDEPRTLLFSGVFDESHDALIWDTSDSPVQLALLADETAAAEIHRDDADGFFEVLRHLAEWASFI